MHNKNTLFKIDCEQCWRDLCKMLIIPVLAILGIVILCVVVANRDEKPKTHSPGGIIPAQPERKAGVIPGPVPPNPPPKIYGPGGRNAPPPTELPELAPNGLPWPNDYIPPAPPRETPK